MHRTLNDRSIRALKPAKPGQRYTLWDAIVPSFGIRVTDKATKTFGIMKRVAGGTHPKWLAIAQYGEITLEQARETAREWLTQIKAGVDPRDVAKQKREAETEKQLAAERLKLAVLDSVAEEFFSYMRKRGLRQARRVEVRIRNEVLPHWGSRSVHGITRNDVEDLIRDIAERPAPRYAHNIFDDVRALFGWCVDVADRRAPYKLTASPCDRIKPTKLIGRKAVRTRVLDNPELRALWKACETIGYPYGRAVQLLMLVGCRLNEAAGAQRREFNGGWIIPAARFKSRQEHRLPITGDMRALLDGLPESKTGDFLFSNSDGERPIGGFSHVKRRIDELMGDVPPWSFHDVRRSVRTRLSGLQIPTRDGKSTVPIPDHVAEMVIGHGRKGLQRVYDQEKYEFEIRAALEVWQAKLGAIISPPNNVVALPARA
jgi:integrase